METPPSYAPPKKSNTGLIIGLVLGGIAICCIGGVALLGFFGFKVFKDTVAPMAECMINYEAIKDSVQDYADANDGKLPSAEAWQDQMAPYVEKRLAKLKKDSGPFKLMDTSGEWSCTMGDKKTGMAFNVDMGGKKLEDVRKEDDILIFEVEQIGRNVAQKYKELDKSTSPKLFGERRGWVTLTTSLDLRMGNKDINNGDFN